MLTQTKDTKSVSRYWYYVAAYIDNLRGEFIYMPCGRASYSYLFQTAHDGYMHAAVSNMPFSSMNIHEQTK